MSRLVSWFVDTSDDEEGTSNEEMLPSEWPVGMSEGESSVLLIDIGGPMTLWTVTEVDLGYIRKLAKHGPGSKKPANSFPPCLPPQALPEVPASLPSIMNYKL